MLQQRGSFSWLMFPFQTMRRFASKLAVPRQQISSVSFILKITIPLSHTLLAALFITCNHNNLSSLVARQKEFLSQGVFVPCFF